MLANLATALLEHRSITTTEHRAKRLRPVVEKLITLGKRGDLHARRKVMTTIKDKGVVHELFTEIAPAMAERQGGYTRITKTAPRKGDNAPMAVIELVMEPVSPKQATVREAEKATERAAQAAAPKSPESPESAQSPAEPAEEAAAQETAAAEQAGAEASAEAATDEAQDAGAADTGETAEGTPRG